MIERIKTVLLILFVAMSIVLTWQIWTYQPAYEFLLPTQYVAQEGIAEKRELQELIKPALLVYHYGEGMYRATYPDSFQYTVIQGQMKDWYFYHFKEFDPENDPSWAQRREEVSGVELIFPTQIPFSLLTNMFQFQMEETLKPVNRIWIYHDEAAEEVVALFFSEENGQLTKAKTGISPTDLKTYLALGESKPIYEAFTFSGQGRKLAPVHYLNSEPVEMMEHHYFYQRIPIHSMIPHLFVDPSFVRQIQEREGGTFFTDGSKGLQYDQNQLSMHFFHPGSEIMGLEEENFTAQSVQRSIQFVNQHQGWEDNYVLHSIAANQAEQQVEVTFRKYIGSYPIYSQERDKDVNVIQLGLQQEKVRSYFRPLFKVDKLMNQVPRTLPAGNQLIAHLIQQDFPMEQIVSIELGYQSQLYDDYLKYIPMWVISLEDGTRLFINQLPEEDSRALE